MENKDLQITLIIPFFKVFRFTDSDSADDQKDQGYENGNTR